jgi:formylglycine-generating enzyme required for sulfatase activity
MTLVSHAVVLAVMLVAHASAHGDVEYGRLKILTASLQACPGQYNAATWTDCVGEWSFQNGAVYTGAWKDGKRSGQGTEIFPSGETYVGEWVGGDRNGQGTVTFADGAKYAGEWRSGDFTGQGIETHPSGRSYVGGWMDFKHHGRGTAISPNGTKYVGDFKDDAYSGLGTLVSPDGTKYFGEFKGGRRHGQGTVTYPNGVRFVGVFSNNEGGNGPGIEYGPDGKILRSGHWENGFFLGDRSAASALASPVRTKRDTKVKPGTVFRDCEACPEMVAIAPGRFLMGSPAAEEKRNVNEGPLHRVSIARPFAAGRYEVTFDEWDACLRERGCSHVPKTYGWGRGRRPVIDVSWQDAMQYTRWLSRKTGKRYRLLTEAEWEYVARAGTSTAFSTGPVITAQQANYDEKPEQTAPVGNFGANAFGLFDVHGNVWEWTADCRNENYAGAPADGAAWLRGDCTHRIARGGSWVGGAEDIRSAAREVNPMGGRYSGGGVRIARTLAK